jgi:hypothetical protein
MLWAQQVDVAAGVQRRPRLSEIHEVPTSPTLELVPGCTAAASYPCRVPNTSDAGPPQILSLPPASVTDHLPNH